MGKKRVFDADESDNEIEAELIDAPTSSAASEEVKSVKKAKQLPEGYVCKICGMEEHHAAYDCPHKVKKFTKDKTSTTTSSADGNTDGTVDKSATNNRFTVFISGLPFDLNRETLSKFLVEGGCVIENAKKAIKLVMFEDNPKRCKGLAYVKFHSEEQVASCLALSGRKFGPLNLSIERVESSRPKATKNTHKAVIAQHGVAQAKRCFRCGMHHDPSTCTNPRICYRCKSTEHLSSACPMKKA